VEEERPFWERQPWDTQASFERFHRFYLAQESPRSLNEAYRRYRSETGQKPARGIEAPGSWRQWFRGQNSGGKRIPGALTWEERADAYDDHVAERERRRWESRRRGIREEDYQHGTRLRALSDQMLAQTPQFLKTTRRLVKGQGGQPDREVITVALDGTFLLRTVKLASDLQRLAAEMATEQTEVSADVRITADDLAAARDRARQFEEELLNGFGGNGTTPGGGAY